MSEIINTLSNQDFAVFDKFRLKASTEKIKEMPLKMHETKILNRNESCISDFFSSPFSPVMAKMLGKMHHWHWTKFWITEKCITDNGHFDPLKKFVCRNVCLYWIKA